MKCIKTTENTIRRLPDGVAAAAVAAGRATFVSKSEWKKVRDTVSTPAPREMPKKPTHKTVSRRADFKARGNRTAKSVRKS